MPYMAGKLSPSRSILSSRRVVRVLRVRQNAGIHNLYKFRLRTPAGENRIVNAALPPLVTRKFEVGGRAGDHG